MNDFEQFLLPNPWATDEPAGIPRTLQFDPNPGQADPPDAGVTGGYLVIWDGKPGPASAARVGVLHDGDGLGSLVISGEFEPVTVTTEENG